MPRMVVTAALASPASLITARLHLVPMSTEYLDPKMDGLQHDEFMRLTGTHGTFTRDAVERFLARVAQADDRADWAILQASDETTRTWGKWSSTTSTSTTAA